MTIYEAPTDMRGSLSARKLVAEIALLLAGVVVLTLTGPFATYLSGPWPVRLLYWGRTLAIGYLLYRPVLWLAGRIAWRLGVPEAAMWGLAVLLITGPMSLWLWYFGPAPDWHRSWPDVVDFFDTAVQSLVLASLYAVSLWWLHRGAPSSAPLTAHSAEAAAVSPAPPRLLSRLPSRLGKEIIALRSEDHYVRVYTRLGDELILSRLSDAIADMVGIHGEQVHKSWWIAQGTVIGAQKNGRDFQICLEGGLNVPVSRSRLRHLREAGWLK